ncbi:expressed unknown protein [Seminavis robusta]|uniref:Uncharacterized protein n=1 Tax=Seminavis robusta TaxID=568900 RepID=A0A9N8D5L2_9STRA|nr:expressed unknown protein [Seminavis robusta]|eukprot:Sro11_g008530.1 n/a (385) ;mRNA; f:77755-78909
MTTRSSRRRRPSLTSDNGVNESSDSLASMIAADWEDAMLQTCMSTEEKEGEVKKKGVKGGIRQRPNKRQPSDEECGSGEDNDKLQQMLRYPTVDHDDDESTVFDDDCSIFSSDSDDISLCRTSPRRVKGNNNTGIIKRPKPPRQGPNSNDENESPRYSPADSGYQDPLDGDCSAVSSLASLFLGQDPCNFDEEEGQQHHRHHSGTLGVYTHNTRRNNTPFAPSHPLLKKSSLKQVSSIGYTNNNSSSSNSLNNSKRHNNVRFDTVNFREYAISLSQNPSCSEGPPIELGWEFEEQESVPVEQYEDYKSKHFPRRRRLQELVLSDSVRRRMLSQRYTPDELAEAVREVEQLKRQRVMTYLMLPASTLDEAAEEVYRYMMRVFQPN